MLAWAALRRSTATVRLLCAAHPLRPPLPPQGETLFREGDAATRVLFVVEGELELLKSQPGRPRLPSVVVEHAHTHAVVGLSEVTLKEAHYRVSDGRPFYLYPPPFPMPLPPPPSPLPPSHLSPPTPPPSCPVAC